MVASSVFFVASMQCAAYQRDDREKRGGSTLFVAVVAIRNNSGNEKTAAAAATVFVMTRHCMRVLCIVKSLFIIFVPSWNEFWEGEEEENYKGPGLIC